MVTRHKKLLITICILASFLFLGLLSIFFYIHTSHAGRQIQAQINNRIPGQIIFKDYELALHKGEIALGNILLKDHEGHMVAGIDQLVLHISFKPLFSRNIVFDHILIKNPQIKLIVDAGDNISLAQAFALPKEEREQKIRQELPKDKKPSTNLIIKDFLLENGSVLFENESKGLRGDLKDIQLKCSGNLNEQSWQMVLSSGEGSFQSPGGMAQLDRINISGAIKEDTISAFDLKIKTPASNLTMLASAQNIFSDPRLDLGMDFEIHLPELGDIFFPESGYTGHIAGNLSVKGDLSDPHASLHTAYTGGELDGLHLETIRLQAVLRDRILDLSPVQIDFIDGNITAHIIANFKEVFPVDFLTRPESYEGISYDINLMVNNVRIEELLGKDFGSKGLIKGALSAKGAGIYSNNAVSDFQLEFSGSGITTGNIAPIDVLVKTIGSLKEGKVVVEQLNADAGPTKLQADGTYHITSKNINANIKARSKDIAATIDPLGITGVQGAFNLEANASGTLEKPSIEFLLKGNDFQLKKVTLGNIDISANLSEGILLIQKAIINNRDSFLEISGSLGIFEQGNLNLMDDFPLNLKLMADPVFLEDFTDQGNAKISMTALIQGTLKNPQGNYEIKAEKIEHDIQNLDNIFIKGNLANKKIHFEPLQIVFSPGQSIDGSGWISTDKNIFLELASGGIFLNQIKKIREQNLLEGLLVLDISAEGNLDNPKIKGMMASKELSFNQKDLGNIHVNINISDYLAQLSGRLNFDFSAAYHLKQKDFNINFHFDDADLAPYFDLAGLTDFSGIISGKVQASGNVSTIRQTGGSGQISLFNLSMKGQELVQAENFTITLENQQILIPDTKFRLFEEGNLNIDAIASFDGPLQIKADGTIPLQGLALVTQSLPDITGRLQISANVEGTAGKPDIRGEIFLDQISFTIPELSQKLHGINGRIIIFPDLMQMEKIHGYLDTGSFQLDGKVRYKDFSAQQVNLDLAVRSIPLKIPDTLNILLQSDLTLSGTPDKAFLSGDVVILEGIYYKDVNVSLVHGITQKKRPVTPKKAEIANPLIQNLNFDISIKRRNPFYVDNNLAYLDINPDIRLTGTAPNPKFEGRTTIESGTIQYQKKSFTVQKGIIDFLNPYELEPTVNLKSYIKIRRWLITMTVSGTPDNLVVTLKSEPPEEDGDIISLLLLGRTTRELIAREGGSGRSSEQMVAELIAVTLGEDIKQITGLDFFEVETDSDDEVNNESEGVKVTVGKKLSERLTFKYSVDSRTGEMIQRAISEYRILENIILSAFQDTSGIFGGEIQYRLEFR